MTLFRALQNPSCNKTAVKVGSYILGEYGNLISDKPGKQEARFTSWEAERGRRQKEVERGRKRQKETERGRRR
jgi:hypothetical protein